MSTAPTETLTSESSGTLFFDATCGLCSAAVARWRGLLRRSGFAVLPLQCDVAKRELHLNGDELLNEMKLVSDRRVFGGVDALIEIGRHIWWARPLTMLSSIPLVRNWLRRGYAALAKRRSCFDGACPVGRTRRDHKHIRMGWLPVFISLLATLPLRERTEAWIFMWAFAFSIFIAKCV